MKKILTVGCEIPGGFGEQLAFFSKGSLLDGEIVLFQPTISNYTAYESYQGKPLHSESSSFRMQEAVAHWKNELSGALKAGKTVFLLLCDVEQVFVHTGEKQYSGTGRNRETTNIVKPVSNYDLLPFSMKVVEAQGTSMTLVPGNALLREYWQEFGDESAYRVYLPATPGLRPLVTVKGSDRIVGGLFLTKDGGALVTLPWLDFYQSEFLAEEFEAYEDDEVEWPNEAKAWGKKFCNALESLDQNIWSRCAAAVAPQWVLDEEFRTGRETALVNDLDQVLGYISNLEKKRDQLGLEIKEAGSWKALLFEQGTPLEQAVLSAMRLLGFEAHSYRDADSEFDAVLESPEGRCIGEVEGRDNRAIDINKMRQLEVNIQEDLSRDEVSEPAQAVLFGNAYRLTPPMERPEEQFTEKCMTAARRNGTALVRTFDLFEVARKLSDNFDADFARACREAIFTTAGNVVSFPNFAETRSIGVEEGSYDHEESP